MDHIREKTSAFFTGLAHRKQRPAIVPLSRSLGPLAPQTSLIFELPDELILSILSHVSPDPRLTGYCAWFCRWYSRTSRGYHHDLRMQILRRLSMTCKAMRLRLVPWVWERLELPSRSWNPGENFIEKLNSIANALHADIYPATSVRFMTLDFPRTEHTLTPFVECLRSLQNLHTLDIRSVDCSTTTLLQTALKGVKLPQIKTLILPPAAYPLLQHCHDVEDVACMVWSRGEICDEFHRSLASNRHSKVKRLVIPLDRLSGPSQCVTACPRLAELSVISPHPTTFLTKTDMGTPFDWAERTHPAMSDLIVACKALPDFNTLQIVLSVEQWEQILGEYMEYLKEWTVDDLKKLKIGCLEGEGRKRITLRIIEFGYDHPPHRRCTRVKEYEV